MYARTKFNYLIIIDLPAVPNISCFEAPFEAVRDDRGKLKSLESIVAMKLTGVLSYLFKTDRTYSMANMSTMC